MRRIKAVSLSIPCVVGPYASVNCRLTLLRNEVRQLPEVRSGYPRGNDDDRFIVRYGASESIITSSGRDDSGLFETSMRDERYLPFEGAGAVGRWRLEMANKTPQFDFDTISDLVLHLRHTARDGGDDLRDAAQEAWFPEAPATPSPPRYTTLLSVRTDFAAEWARTRATGGALQVQLGTNLLPYWMTALQLSIRKVSLLSLPVADASDDSSFVPEERWPQATLPSDVLALGADGTGVASLGVVAPGVNDILLILAVGVA